MNARTSNTNGKQCGCGSGCGGQCGCDSQCCELECLVRPNFFCGQLLTDADLAAMVEWTRGRLALARYRDGWGVACGLELSCSAPGAAASCCGDQAAGSGLAVYVNAGYALDCCGNDLVLCEPLKVDLGPVCRPPDDPCAPRATAAGAPPPQVPPAPEGGAPANCLQLRADELFAVQLSLRYHEDLAQGQRAMFRGACSDDGPCQYARVLERPCAHLEVVPLRAGQDDGGGEDLWSAAFQPRLEREVAAIRDAVVQGTDAILKYIRRHPPYQFCFLEEMVCCLRENETENQPTSSPQRLHIAKLLLVDWLLRQLQCPCGSCLPDDGVPLGRILLRRQVEAGRAQCSVVMIEQGDDFRRPLRKDPCREVGAGRLDLAAYLWQPAGRAMAQLESRGIQVRQLDASPEGSEQLRQVVGTFAKAVMSAAPASAPLGAYVVDDIEGRQRIACFVLL